MLSKFFGVIAILLFLAGPVLAGGLELKNTAGEYTVSAVIDKKTPVVGKNKMEVVITGRDATPVADAKVRVEYSMPAMPGMPAMDYKTDAVLVNGKYEAFMELSMAGSWNVEIKFKRGTEKVQKVKFTLDAQ